MISILLAEDDESLGFLLEEHLKDEGHNVTLCKDGEKAWSIFSKEAFDLCILDVMMPKKDGFTLAKEIRTVDKHIPILFLSAKSDTEDKITGLKAGADDYLTKPFSTEELALRIEALLRRANKTQDTLPREFKIGSYKFNVEDFSLTHNKTRQKLTKKEAKILLLLCENINHIVTKEKILNQVWGKADYFTGRSCDVFITKLRKYLSKDDHISLSNIHGIGFKLEVK